ncbi:MAG TPA: nucleotidyl transferase AbiEii/AbiGii toxin family protein, partial [Steroidobacteraceae bacterium]|nr:nucleotidyl transferase AbiEii/AbiGii toxin family protein [Steroidobacteraceae bacterium]
MISDKEIEAKAQEFSITPINVEKDYVHSWLLKSIYARPALAARLILKGGQAIRKGYLPQTRFSKDLDFSTLAQLDCNWLETELREVCAQVSAASGVTFLDKVIIKDKNLAIPGVDAIEARLYFKGFYGEEDLNLRAQLDVTQFDKMYLPAQSRRLLHAYSDATDCVATIRTQKLEEILASKLTAMLHRRKPADMFDLLYAILIAREYPVSRLEIISTFLRKSIFEPEPDLAKNELLAIPIAAFERDWSTLVVPAAALLAFSYAVGNFHALIESLFAAIIPAVRIPTGFASPLGRLGLAPGRIAGAGAFARVSPLAPGPRNVIVSAARNGHMIEMQYDGIRRVVEPYKLEYYVRKTDHVGS